MTSEFSTQRTQTKDRGRYEGNNTDRGVVSQKSNTDGNKKETPLPRHLDDIAGGYNGEIQAEGNQSPSVQILNSEPIRRFNLPDSDSEKSPNHLDRQRSNPIQSGGTNQSNFNIQMQMILPEDEGQNIATSEKKNSSEVERPPKPYLKVEPLEIDFGTVYLGQVGSRSVNIKASCLSDVEVKSSLY